jgi:anti-sigma B factor antagonist
VNVRPEVTLDYRDAVPVASLEGELDVLHANDLRGRLIAAVRNEDLGLVIDLTAVSYVDSAVINVLFALAERLSTRQLRLALVVPEHGLVERVLGIVNIAAVAEVHPDADAAVNGVRTGAAP